MSIFPYFQFSSLTEARGAAGVELQTFAVMLQRLLLAAAAAAISCAVISAGWVSTTNGVVWVIVIMAGSITCVTGHELPYLASRVGPQWTLTFEDDFDGAALNLSQWTVANNYTHGSELQLYLDDEVYMEKSTPGYFLTLSTTVT